MMVLYVTFFIKVSNGTFIYMTFDDGPNEGTPYVLDALKQNGVRLENKF